MKRVSCTIYEGDFLAQLEKIARENNISVDKFKLAYCGSEGFGQVHYCSFEAEISNITEK